MATVSKFQRQFAPTAGQRAAATGVKFWPGPSSIPGERVTSGLVWRFGTVDCVSDNLACFKDGFGDSGSFLDIGGHHFYVAKPFSEEVTDVLDPLSDGGSSYDESYDFGAMVNVMALGDEEGGDSPRSARPPLERLPLQEQNTPSQSGTPRTSPSWTCAHCLTTSSTPPGSRRPWRGRASFSSVGRLRRRLSGVA
jgi:hypothetical protein